jgi:CheY-like chemotaxis protein
MHAQMAVAVVPLLSARRPDPRPLIALVDDDALFRESLILNLTGAGFAVQEWGDGEAFLATLSIADDNFHPEQNYTISPRNADASVILA